MKMGDSSVNEIGLHTRAAALLNKKTFSDVEIQVKDGNSHKTFFAHKLFLAMGSQEFADMFYSAESPNCIKIFDYKPQTVYVMLQYLYTNKLEILDKKEARELYTLSKKFGVRNLQELCVDYISKDELNKDNVLHMYESALREKFTRLLADCQNVVSLNTKEVFKSPNFVEASVAVVKDIFQLDSLAIDSEQDVLFAALEWGRYECKRRKLPYNFSNLRSCVDSLLGHIRFLTLTVEEFYEFVQKYNILSSHESSLITRVLLVPQSRVSMLKGFSQISKPRENPSVSMCTKSATKQGGMSKLQHPIPQANKPEFKISLLKANTPPQFSTKSNTPMLPAQSGSSAIPPHANTNKISPVVKVMPQVTKHQQRKFDFSLQEMQKIFFTAFTNDVRCVATIHLLKGAVSVHGIQLKISQKPTCEEVIKVFFSVSISGVNSPIRFSDTYNEALKEGVLSLTFKQPWKFYESSTAKVEVTVEDLELNRCSIIKNPACELNCGSEILADIALTSNQMNRSGDYFFLISSLIYSAI